MTITEENNFLMMYCSFNGPQVGIDPLFEPWLSENSKSDVFKVFNYTQCDISRELDIPFPVKKTENIFYRLCLLISPKLCWIC